MGALTSTITIGTKSTNAAHAADLGKTIILDGKIYRMVKCTATISAAAGKVLATALSSGVPTWSVATTTTANDHTAVGVVPSSFVGALADGDYFFLQCSGPAKLLSAAAISAGALVGASTTAGKGDDASITAGIGAIGVALEAATGADELIDVMLKGIV